MANPYTMGSLYHSPGVQSYCGPTENLSLAGHYSDMRSSASWYGTTANDPRFASKSNLNGIEHSTQFLFDSIRPTFVKSKALCGRQI